MSIKEIVSRVKQSTPRRLASGLLGVALGVALLYGAQQILASSKEQDYPLLAKRVQIDNPNEVV